MKTVFQALWQGGLNGAQTRTRDEALAPQRYGISGSFAQGVYWFAFEVTNIVVYGAKQGAHP